MPNTKPAVQTIARAYCEAMATKDVEGLLARCDGKRNTGSATRIPERRGGECSY
jgi:hypothetical protein